MSSVPWSFVVRVDSSLNRMRHCNAIQGSTRRTDIHEQRKQVPSMRVRGPPIGARDPFDVGDYARVGRRKVYQGGLTGDAWHGKATQRSAGATASGSTATR